MNDMESFLILDTMCKLAVAGRSDDDVFKFGRRMAEFAERIRLPIEPPFAEECEAAKRKAGIA